MVRSILLGALLLSVGCGGDEDDKESESSDGWGSEGEWGATGGAPDPFGTTGSADGPGDGGEASDGDTTGTGDGVDAASTDDGTASGSADADEGGTEGGGSSDGASSGGSSGADPDGGGDASVSPSLSITPEAVSMDGTCGREERVVEAENLGGGPITITAVEVEGEGWSVEHELVPITLETGDSFSVTVSADSGAGVLTLSTDDSSHPSHTVTLNAVSNPPPTIDIVAPDAGVTLPASLGTTFRAIAGDEYDEPSALGVEWSLSGGTVLDSGYADASGLSTFEWSPEFGIGAQVLTATVTDVCGASAETAIGFCQNDGYVEDDLDIDAWHFEGSALWDADNEWVELTAPMTMQAGTAFQTRSTVLSGAVNIEFDFYASGGSGADGLSLTAIDVDRMTTFVGGTGGGLGYTNLPGWTVEIDTWYNLEHNDPTSEDHLSVHIDGDINTPVAWATLPDMEDEEWHSAKVSLLGTYMQIWIDGDLYMDQDVTGLYDFDAYLGFTASTGRSTNHHLIDAIDVEVLICDE